MTLLYSKALHLIEEHDLDKKLNFLNLSYQRLPVFHNEMNIFYPNTIEPPPVEQKIEMTNRKKSYMYWGMWASILLLLLFFTITKSDAYQQSSAEKFIEKSKVTFLEELNRNLMLAGLPGNQSRLLVMLIWRRMERKREESLKI